MGRVAVAVCLSIESNSALLTADCGLIAAVFEVVPLIDEATAPSAAVETTSGTETAAAAAAGVVISRLSSNIFLLSRSRRIADRLLRLGVVNSLLLS